MFTILRTNVPVVTVAAGLDDTGFTELVAWGLPLRTELRAAREAGIILHGRVRLALNLARRMLDDEEFTPDCPLQVITTLSAEYDCLVFFVDVSLPDDTALLE